jgi:hypothetical protein
VSIFFSILLAAFACKDPQKCKKTVKLSVFFAYLGSECVKAVHRTLMILTPVNRDLQLPWPAKKLLPKNQTLNCLPNTAKTAKKLYSLHSQPAKAAKKQYNASLGLHTKEVKLFKSSY